jgi:hypothetical protein
MKKGGSAATSSALFAGRGHQCVARGRQRQESAGISPGIRMHPLGDATERLMDFAGRKPSVERQAQHLAMALLGRQDFRRSPPAE